MPEGGEVDRSGTVAGSEALLVYDVRNSGRWADPSCWYCQHGTCAGHSVKGPYSERVMFERNMIQPASDKGAGKANVPLVDSPSEVPLHCLCHGYPQGVYPMCPVHGTAKEYNAVEPPHYSRGPMLRIELGERITKAISTITHPLSCIEVMRHIKDPRLATAFKYIWRVSFGGKREPGDTRSQREIDERDISSAVWYLTDWLSNPTE